MSAPQYGFDPEALLQDEIVVDKLDAACRQLESAIAMFFEEWDVVSQHTLISAAYGILYDLGKRRGIAGSVKDSSLVRAEDRAGFIRAIHLPQNFFKHARQDSERRSHFDIGSATSSSSTRSACLYCSAAMRRTR